MYFCYLDESGTPEPGGTSRFVLVGLAIISTDWKRLEAQIHAVTSPFGLGDEEIHTAWMQKADNDIFGNFTGKEHVGPASTIFLKPRFSLTAT